jgi:hypothetical protein
MRTFILLFTCLFTHAFATTKGFFDIASRHYPEFDVSPPEVTQNHPSLVAITEFSALIQSFENLSALSSKISREEEFEPEILKKVISESNDSYVKLKKTINSHGLDLPHYSYRESDQFSSIRLIDVSKFLSLKLHYDIHITKDSIASLENLQFQKLLISELLNDNHSLVHTLVTIAIYASYYENILAYLESGNLSNSTFVELQELNIEYSQFNHAMQNSVNGEFQHVSNEILPLLEETTSLEQFHDPFYALHKQYLPNDIFSQISLNRKRDFMRLVYQPNKTLKLYADSYRDIKNQLATNEILELKPELTDKTWAPLNIFGSLLFEMTNGVIRKQYIRSAPSLLLHTRIYPLVIALRSYQEANDELPQNLEQLVPQYIDQLPIDPYSEEPFMYSRAKKLLWSIGNDKKDNNGISKDLDRNSRRPNQLDKLDEPSLKLPF